MTTSLRPWTFVFSEYLDLPFLLRRTGEQVVSARSCSEALDHLRSCSPVRIVVDDSCAGAQRVLNFAAQHCRSSTIEPFDHVVARLLAS